MTDTAFPPPNSCDCHLHVIGPKAKYPLVSPRAYTPMDAPLPVLEAMLKRLGLHRVALIQTSVFGTDNSCMLDAITAMGGRARGVAVVADEMPAAELDRLHAGGVRGLRVNLATLGKNDPAAARGSIAAAARHCARNGWHLQLFTTAATITALADDLAALPVPVVIDHFGLLSPAEPDSPAERVLKDLLSTGQGWVKISGTYRLKPADLGPAMTALVHRLHAANPEHVVWGSDWPHSPPHPEGAIDHDREMPYRDLDTGALLGTIRQWFEEPRRWQEILVDNPARLYGF